MLLLFSWSKDELFYVHFQTSCTSNCNANLIFKKNVQNQMYKPEILDASLSYTETVTREGSEERVFCLILVCCVVQSSQQQNLDKYYL